MKTNSKKKIVVSALAIAMGAALVGSISGSVAWYQYSTRASALIAGTSAGTQRNLLVKNITTGATLGTTYSNHIDLEDADDLPSYRPVSVVQGTSALSFVEHPVYKQAVSSPVTDNDIEVDGVTTWAYKEYKLAFQCVDYNNASTASYKAKKVYLSHFAIVKTGTNDVAPAVRVQIEGTHDFILSQGDETSTVTKGELDLNGNGKSDKDHWSTMDPDTATAIEYKNAESNGESYTMQAKSDAVVTITDIYDFDDDNKVLATTPTSDADTSFITVRVWLEGWQPLEDETIWDKKFMQQDFEIQMEFACEADKQ